MTSYLINVIFFLAVLALSFSSLSTLAAGMSWLLFIVLGLCSWLLNKNSRVFTESPRIGSLGLPASKIWLTTCLLASLFYLIPTVYWGGPWGERHPQLRLLSGALATVLCIQYFSYTKQLANLMMYALSASSIFAYGLVVTFSSDAAPTNRIPWMAGLSLVSCVLLVGSYQLKSTSLYQRSVWLFGSALVLVTAILSGVRGSWTLLIIWPLTLLYLHRNEVNLWRKTWRLILLSMSILLLAGATVVPGKDNPLFRVKQVIQEVGLQSDASGPISGTSGGVRVALYSTGIISVVNNISWLGIGPLETKSLIGKIMNDSGSVNHNHIGHFHSDAIHVAVEFGVMGLIGYIGYFLGMIVIFFRLAIYDTDVILKIGIISLSLIHISTGLTNMNFAHNYYPVMLSLAVMIIFFNETVR